MNLRVGAYKRRQASFDLGPFMAENDLRRTTLTQPAAPWE